MKPKRQIASQTAHYQKTSISMTDRRLNDRWPSNDDPRLDQNISLEKQRARLEAELESETDAGTISWLLCAPAHGSLLSNSECRWYFGGCLSVGAMQRCSSHAEVLDENQTNMLHHSDPRPWGYYIEGSDGHSPPTP